MAIKDDNTRIIVTISKELKSKLDYFCEKDKRTLSKEVEYIIEKHIQQRE